MPVLQATGVSVSFGGVRAVVGVDLEVEAGQLVGLIGPNGAGKTTFIDAISGFVRSTGTVTLDGRDVSGLAAHERARLGLARTWQSIELFDDLTVQENLLAALERPTLRTSLAGLVGLEADRSHEVVATLELLGLTELASVLPADLSQGQRKLVGIARALVGRPRLVCLDEPAAGLDTRESEELGRRLRQIVDAGQSMLLVDHDMGLVLGICDEVVVLEFGEVIARGAPDAVRTDARVVTAYLGGAAASVVSEAASGAAPGAAPA